MVGFFCHTLSHYLLNICWFSQLSGTILRDQSSHNSEGRDISKDMKVVQKTNAVDWCLSARGLIFSALQNVRLTWCAKGHCTSPLTKQEWFVFPFFVFLNEAYLSSSFVFTCASVTTATMGYWSYPLLLVLLQYSAFELRSQQSSFWLNLMGSFSSFLQTIFIFKPGSYTDVYFLKYSYWWEKGKSCIMRKFGHFLPKDSLISACQINLLEFHSL